MNKMSGQRTFFVVFDNDRPISICIDKKHADLEICRQKDKIIFNREAMSQHYIHYHEVPVAKF